MKRPTISVIIPTRDGKVVIARVLRSVLNQKINANIQTIVINNASQDGTPELVKHRFRTTRLVSLQRNSGVTGGRNAGIRATPTTVSYYLFLDHDIILKNDCLLNLVEALRGESSAGIATPQIRYLKNPERLWSCGTSVNLLTGQVFFPTKPPSGVVEVQVAPACLLVRRQVIEAIGGFDDRYFASWEDTDFCFRARKSGFKTVAVPAAIAYHDLPNDPSEEMRRLLRLGYYVTRNRLFFLRRHSPFWPLPLLFQPIFLVRYLWLAARFRNRVGAQGTLLGFSEGLRSSLDEEPKSS